MTTLRTLVAAAAILLSTAACAPGMADSNGPVPARSDIEVQVTNNNWSDMTVYAVRAGMRTRLGTVTSMNTMRFDLPTAYAQAGADVHLVADPIGSRDAYSTQPIQIVPGQTVDFTIENHLAISNVAVW
jgi:hypothetical protein